MTRYKALILILFFSLQVRLFTGTSHASIYNSSENAQIRKDTALADKYEQEIKTDKALVIFYYVLGGSLILIACGYFIGQVRKSNQSASSK